MFLILILNIKLIKIGMNMIKKSILFYLFLNYLLVKNKEKNK